MNNQKLIEDIKESFDFLCAMRTGQFYAQSFDNLGEFFFAVNDADSLFNEQRAGIAEFGREFGLGKAKYALATSQMPAHYVFQGKISDLKPAEAMAKMRNNQEVLKQLRAPKLIINDEDGSDPAYKSLEPKPSGSWQKIVEKVREQQRKEAEQIRIEFKKKQDIPTSDVDANDFESAVDRHRRKRLEKNTSGSDSNAESAVDMQRRKKLGDSDVKLDPTFRKIPSGPGMRR